MYAGSEDEFGGGPRGPFHRGGPVHAHHGGPPHRHGGPGGPKGPWAERRHQRGMRHHLAPTLLLLLKGGPRHGYALMAELGDALPRPEAMPDVSSVYRMLAQFEEEGSVVSRWEAGDGGGRRVYELTVQGEEVLAGWIGLLEEEKRRLDRLIERYRR